YFNLVAFSNIGKKTSGMASDAQKTSIPPAAEEDSGGRRGPDMLPHANIWTDGCPHCVKIC
ncbi:hypothetical protein, partial [Alistipes ihumii]|uniref:hypothetical protein n=1 Tax=Alistipes ihumii TaxID=1470347 RepID=UPI003AB4BE39